MVNTLAKVKIPLALIKEAYHEQSHQMGVDYLCQSGRAGYRRIVNRTGIHRHSGLQAAIGEKSS
jgi:hypothetical protein